MSKEIDWSKAPEGTTHLETSYGEHGFWYKFDFQNDTAAYCPSGESRWRSSGKASDYNDGSMKSMVARPLSGSSKAEQREQTRSAIIELAWKQCGIQGDAIRQLATALVADGYRKFEIVDEEQ